MTTKISMPDLLDQFMEESGEIPRWVTVEEVRARFDLDTSKASMIAGFLRRISSGTFPSCRYRVERIEQVPVVRPHPRMINRYLVAERPWKSKRRSHAPSGYPAVTSPGTAVLL